MEYCINKKTKEKVFSFDIENEYGIRDINIERELRFLGATDQILCPECKTPVILRAGEIKVPHFAHKNKTKKCFYSTHTYSEDRQRALRIIYNELKKDDSIIISEMSKRFGDYGVIDILVKTKNYDINKNGKKRYFGNSKTYAILVKNTMADYSEWLSFHKKMIEKGITPIYFNYGTTEELQEFILTKKNSFFKRNLLFLSGNNGLRLIDITKKTLKTITCSIYLDEANNAISYDSVYEHDDKIISRKPKGKIRYNFSPSEENNLNKIREDEPFLILTKENKVYLVFRKENLTGCFKDAEYSELKSIYFNNFLIPCTNEDDFFPNEICYLRYYEDYNVLFDEDDFESLELIDEENKEDMLEAKNTIKKGQIFLENCRIIRLDNLGIFKSYVEEFLFCTECIDKNFFNYDYIGEAAKKYLVEHKFMDEINNKKIFSNDPKGIDLFKDTREVRNENIVMSLIFSNDSLLRFKDFFKKEGYHNIKIKEFYNNIRSENLDILKLLLTGKEMMELRFFDYFKELAPGLEYRNEYSENYLNFIKNHDPEFKYLKRTPDFYDKYIVPLIHEFSYDFERIHSIECYSLPTIKSFNIDLLKASYKVKEIMKDNLIPLENKNIKLEKEKTIKTAPKEVVVPNKKEIIKPININKQTKNLISPEELAEKIIEENKAEDPKAIIERLKAEGKKIAQEKQNKRKELIKENNFSLKDTLFMEFSGYIDIFKENKDREIFIKNLKNIPTEYTEEFFIKSFDKILSLKLPALIKFYTQCKFSPFKEILERKNNSVIFYPSLLTILDKRKKEKKMNNNFKALNSYLQTRFDNNWNTLLKIFHHELYLKSAHLAPYKPEIKKEVIKNLKTLILNRKFNFVEFYLETGLDPNKYIVDKRTGEVFYSLKDLTVQLQSFECLQLLFKYNYLKLINKNNISLIISKEIDKRLGTNPIHTEFRNIQNFIECILVPEDINLDENSLIYQLQKNCDPKFSLDFAIERCQELQKK